MNYITLFSCAGIGCHGFKREGFECIATVEIDKKRLEIQKYNNKCKDQDSYIGLDYTTDESKEIINKKINEYGGKLDILIATPPCQGISTLNAKKNSNDINRNSLVVESIKSIIDHNPKIFIFENVKNFLNTYCVDLDGTNKQIKDSIEYNLSGNYMISSNVVNFKNFGVPSSRTRTLVIGIRKDIAEKYNVMPNDLLPDLEPQIPLVDAIGNLKSLKRNEIDESDILHFSKKINDKHLLWISGVKQGKSAFDNEDMYLKPHRIDESGNYIPFASNMGGKYSRQHYDRIGQCVHTFTGNPASQFTIHPIDNRVYSIRELMIMMGISEDFKFTPLDMDELNSSDGETKLKWIGKNEGLIRTVIGESVPTKIFGGIAKKIRQFIN